MKIKNLILTFTFSLISLFGFSQTSIGPMIGYNSAEIVESVVSLHWGCIDNRVYFNKPGYIRNSFKFGLRVNHNINEWFSLTFVPSFMRKKIVDRSCHVFDLKYNMFGGDFITNFELFKSLNIGLGASYSYLNNFSIKSDYFDSNENHIGYIISSSYQYKNLVFDFSFRNIKNLRDPIYRFIISSRSFELSVSYMFEVF